MPYIVLFTGWSGTGKTSLINKLIPMLTSRGYRVGALKGAYHHELTEKNDSDSLSFSKAGANTAGVIFSNGLTLHSHAKWTREQLEILFAQEDILLTEGFRGGFDCHIEIAGTTCCIDDLKNPGCPIVVTDSSELSLALDKLGRSVFDYTDPTLLCHFLISQLDS